MTEVNWKGWRLRNVQICIWQLLQNGKGLTGQEGRRERSRETQIQAKTEGKQRRAWVGAGGLLSWLGFLQRDFCPPCSSQRRKGRAEARLSTSQR